MRSNNHDPTYRKQRAGVGSMACSDKTTDYGADRPLCDEHGEPMHKQEIRTLADGTKRQRWRCAVKSLERQAKWREENPEAIVERNAKYYEENREAILEQHAKYRAKLFPKRKAWAISYLGGLCATCGGTEKQGIDVGLGPFEFDHIYPETKEYKISTRLVSFSKEKLRAELDKCQLLHVECHKAKTLQEAAQRAYADREKLNALINTYPGSEAA